MPELITKAKALELLEAAVAERGADYVYERDGFGDTGPACSYIRDGCPSCLVGLAMTKAGVPIEQLAEWDKRNDSSAYSVLVGDHATIAAADVMATAQERQDSGESWGEALRAAKYVAERSQGD